MDKGNIKRVNFEQITDVLDWDYLDSDIAYYDNFQGVPIKADGSLSVDMLVMAICRKGRMEVEINSTVYHLNQNDIIITIPNDKLDKCMISPDFDGCMLCLSKRIVMECISPSDLWSRAFNLRARPVLHIEDDGVTMFEAYATIFRLKIEHGNKLFRKEVIHSMIRAMMYDLMSVVGESLTPTGNMLTTSREVLFKRFMELLTGSQVKQRKVSWYAERLFVSPKYLSTICKQVSNKTAFDWISDYVCMDIRHLLKNSDKSIKEITDILDFPNISFFGKYCRQHFGVSPMELRKQLRQQSD